MNLEYIILSAVWVLSFVLLMIIPRVKRRLAVVAFLFKQVITYLIGLVTVEMGLLSYPIKFLPDINRTSMTYEFMAFPTICAIFNVFFPYHRSRWFQIGYYMAYCTVLTVTEVILEKYTDLIRYLHWNWFWTWSSLGITLFMTQLFCIWFFKGINHNRANLK